MQVFILYASIVLIWGSTWIAITFQLGPVAEEVSVAYRFLIASLLLFAFALLTRRQLRIPRIAYPLVMAQGVFLFSANYVLVYFAAHYITSGLIAVIFSCLVIFNAFFERLFFKVSVEPRFAIAALLGTVGIALVFSPEISSLSLQDETIWGILLALASVLSASLGNMLAVHNLGKNLPVVSLNAHAMLWGAIASGLYAMLLGREISFSTEPAYLWSLVYLSIFGSAVAFGCMLALIRKIGAARSAYTSVLFPIVALIISTIFEDYDWTMYAVAGIAVALLGNWLALTKPKFK